MGSSADERRERYANDPEYRERRKAQGRDPEANREYMQTYYQNNRERWAERSIANAEQRRQRSRERYANDPEYRERCKQAARNRDKARKRDGRLRAEFGIDSATYDAMLAAQHGQCAICGDEFGDSQQRRLYVDHDHRTGAVRGLLCSECNFGIGKFHDDPALLARAIAYLRAPRTVGHLVYAQRRTGRARCRVRQPRFLD